MNKLRILSILSKIFAHTTWAVSNLYKTASNAGRKAANAFRTDGRFDVEIFKGNEQIDKKHNLSHQQLIDVINTLSVFPSLSLIIHSSDGKGEPVVIDI
tara:strand:- start:1257 stop:1553 length:297 start_codon:yes stop_codon:yes gene_type:complete